VLDADSITRSFEDQIGEPSGPAVYGFAKNVLKLLTKWMSSLAEQTGAELREIPVPANRITGESWRIRLPVFQASGKPLILIEPHCDDVALSVLGTLLKWRRPVTVVTLFDRSRTVANSVDVRRYLSHEEISAVRREENEAALGLGLRASCRFLSLFEEPWPWSEPDASRIAALATRIADTVDLASADLMAPVGYSTHPDHYLARGVAECLGCRVFWEDVGFSREYARCEEDRAFGKCAWPAPLREQIVDLSGVVLLKMALLLVYRSQVDCPTDALESLRYHWAVARGTHQCNDQRRAVRFAERIYFKE
jgi:LmbE family N-acetylglucosaminyl deacetylase